MTHFRSFAISILFWPLIVKWLVGNGNSDVGDIFMLVTFGWWLISDVSDRIIILVTNILNRSPTSQTCHQHIWSPTSVTNIDLIVGNPNFSVITHLAFDSLRENLYSFYSFRSIYHIESLRQSLVEDDLENYPIQIFVSNSRLNLYLIVVIGT